MEEKDETRAYYDLMVGNLSRVPLLSEPQAFQPENRDDIYLIGTG